MGRLIRRRGRPLGQASSCALFLLLGSVACSKTTGPLEDKNTNWLGICDRDELCGEGLRCLCGVCTRGCEDSGACESLAAGASCESVGDGVLESRCGTESTMDGVEAICIADCSSDGDCEASAGADARCEDGLCVRPPRPTAGDPDAGVPSPAASEFEAFVAAHRRCDTVADCTLISPGCPFGCYVAVDEASAAEVEQAAQEARADLEPCVYRCPVVPDLACENSQCVTTYAADDRWTKLDEPPLSGRVEALVAAVGDTIVVAGGWEFVCPFGADCALPDVEPYADGAAYDVTTERWTNIADAPVGFKAVSAAVVGDDVYALSQCDSGPSCPAGRSLLRYRSAQNEWDMLPGPNEEGGYALLDAGDGVIAYRGSDEGGATPDYRLRAGEDVWEPLPDDPLPPVYDRFLVEYEGRFLLFGSPIAKGATATKLAAAYDPQSNTWEELAESKTQGYQVWRSGSLLYLNPHFGDSGGGVYDPSANTWRPLPDPPYYDLAGIIGVDDATYEYSSGWVLDTRNGGWLEIRPRPVVDAIASEVVAEGPQQRMVVFGGHAWMVGDGRQLLNDTWLWNPPPASAPSR